MSVLSHHHFTDLWMTKFPSPSSSSHTMICLYTVIYSLLHTGVLCGVEMWLRVSNIIRPAGESVYATCELGSIKKIPSALEGITTAFAALLVVASTLANADTIPSDDVKSYGKGHLVKQSKTFEALFYVIPTNSMKPWRTVVLSRLSPLTSMLAAQWAAAAKLILAEWN